jgi:pSer/pThr/pTyr-binding forkhead associated (FHA) protein
MGPTGKTVWLAIAAFLPAVGFIIYLAARFLDHFLAPPPDGASRTWRTFPRRPEAGPTSGSTIAAGVMPGQGSGDAERFALFHVVALEGPESGKTYAVARLPALIGRGQDTAISLDADLGVSRHHAEIYAHGQALHLRDLGSTHGASVNGVRVHDQVIRPGDRIGIGQSVLQIQLERRRS